jgi:Polyprenyl synthetase
MRMHKSASERCALARGRPARPFRRRLAGECHVLAPDKPMSTSQSMDPRDRDISVNIDDIRRPVAADMESLLENLLASVGGRHPMLMAAAQQIFSAGGKRLRPMLVFLVARATTRQMQGRCAASPLPRCCPAVRTLPAAAFASFAAYRSEMPAATSLTGTEGWLRLLK